MKEKVESVLRLSYPKMLLNLTAVFSFPVFALLLLVGPGGGGKGDQVGEYTAKVKCAQCN